MKKTLLKLLAVVLLLLSSVGVTVAAETTSDENYQKIIQRGTLIVGTSADWPPFEFTKQVNGKQEYYGADMEMAKKMAKDMGVKLEIKNMSFDSLLVALETKKVDIVIAGMNASPERKKSVDFSDVYYHSADQIVIRKGDTDKIKSYKDLKKLRIGTLNGSVQEKEIRTALKGSKLDITKLSNTNDLMLALQTNKIDAVILSGGVGDAYANSVPGLIAIDGKFASNEDASGSAVAVPKNSPEILASLNKSIADIKDKNLYTSYLKKAGKELGTTSTKTKKVPMWNYRNYFIEGLKVTLFISLIGVLLGFIIGLLFGWLSISESKILRGIARTYIEIIRGTPLMVQMLFVYFGLGTLLNIKPIPAGIIAVSLNSAAYVAEIFRGGINSVPVGQKEAALSVGMTSKQSMQNIILPQAVKTIWPSLGNEFITLIKESSIVSMIGVPDLIYQLKNVQANTYRGIAPIVVVFFIYLVINIGLGALLRIIEKKFK